MRTNLSAAFLSLIATAALMLAANVRPAVAQSTPDDPLMIKATPAAKFTRYYAPYAIQSAAAYLPVQGLNDRYLKRDSEGNGADVEYAVQNIFGGDGNMGGKPLGRGNTSSEATPLSLASIRTIAIAKMRCATRVGTLAAGRRFMSGRAPASLTRTARFAPRSVSHFAVQWVGAEGIGSRTPIVSALLTTIITISFGAISTALSV